MHIRLSDFKSILDDMGFEDTERLAYRIFAAAVPRNIQDRYHVTGDEKTRAKMQKAIQASKTRDMTVQRFNRLLDAQRRAVGHRHITPIRPNTANYALLKEIGVMAADFCHGVGIENIDEGCKIYIQLGLEKMKHSNTYALGKFKYHDEAIYSMYESIDTIQRDPEPERTRQMHDIYMMLLAEYANISRDLTKPEDYVCFVFARLEADRVQAHPEDWLRAQFEQMSKSFDAIPNPRQLFSEWATKRYYDYFRTPLKEQEEIIAMTWNKPKDDFEERYQAKLREKYSEK